jgi:hypothetical protein
MLWICRIVAETGPPQPSPWLALVGRVTGDDRGAPLLDHDETFLREGRERLLEGVHGQPPERTQLWHGRQRRPGRKRPCLDGLPQGVRDLLPRWPEVTRLHRQHGHVPVLGERPTGARQVPAFLKPGVEHVEHRAPYLADLQMSEGWLDRPPDVPLEPGPGGQIPLRDLRILVEQLGDGRAGLRPTPGHNLLEQLAELNLRGNLGLAGLPEPDLTTGQRVLPCVHLDTPGPAR